MSVQVVFYYVAQLANPGTLLGEDVTAGTTHDLIAESIPSIDQQVEQNFAEFTTGDFTLKATNADGWWDFAFGDSTLSPYNRYPLCHYINVFRNGLLIWQGDVDYKTISFDRKAQTVAFTCLSPMNRLVQWSAELVRRPLPYFFDSGVTSEVGAGYIRDYGKSWLIGQVLNAVLIDSIGNLFPITGLYGMGTGPGRNGVTVGTGYTAPYYLTTCGNTPAAGTYRIVPFAVQTKVGPWNGLVQNAVTTGTDATGRFVQDTTQNYPSGALTGMCLYDDAGQVYPITGNSGQKIYVGLTWTPPGATAPVTLPTPTIKAPFSLYAVRRANYPNLLETLPDFKTVGLASGDTLTFVTTGALSVDPSAGFGASFSSQIEEYTLAAVGPCNVVGPSGSITSNQAWTTGSIKYDVDIPHDAVSVTTPYWRNIKVSDLVTKLFQSIGATFLVHVQDFANNYIEYADFGGKSVADALTELAVISNCTLSCGFSGGTSNPTVTFYFQRRDVGVDAANDIPAGPTINLSGTDPSGVPLIVEREDSPQWEQWFPQVTVTGANSVEAAAGSLRYGGSALSIQSDYITSYGWVAQIRDRLWAFFGSRRWTSRVKVRAEYATGIALMSRVSLSGTDTWYVIGLSYSVRDPGDVVDLVLLNTAAWSFTPPDYAATAGPTDQGSSSTSPPPASPQITSIVYTSDPHVFWRRKVTISWSGTRGMLLGFNFTIWSGAIARPTTPFLLVGFSAPAILTIAQLIDNGDGTFTHYIDGSLASGYGAAPFLIDYQAAMVDGRVSSASDPWELDETNHVGVPPSVWRA